jgi:UDP-glucose 4-epimerase
MAKILVTGAAGFIGSHTSTRLLARGDSQQHVGEATWFISHTWACALLFFGLKQKDFFQSSIYLGQSPRIFS